LAAFLIAPTEKPDMKIECTLPNASEEISGIKFARSVAGTMVSVDDVPAAQAARLLKIEGFREAAPEDQSSGGPSSETNPGAPPAPPVPAKDARKAAPKPADAAA
jgi:hypothetical protein